MFELQRILRSLAAVAAGALLISGGLAASAAADPYGELLHFGEKGTALGQLNEPESAIGVDSRDNSVYVVDSVKGNKFRLQKFVNEGGKYTAVASVTFKPTEQFGELPDEVEGVAVDTSLNRVYVLAQQARRNQKAIDPEVPAAAVLYAFKTEPSGTTIQPVEGLTEGILAEQGTLQPTSKEPGVSLLEPSGIAVDPTTNDVIIAATIDRGKKPSEKEATVVLQRISKTGVLGARYVDSRSELNPETGKTEEKSFFEECECTNSPAVSKVGHIYLVGERDQIEEIPASFNGATAPTPVIQLECEVGCPTEHLTEFPGQKPAGGGLMSIGAEGRIYVGARVTLQTGGSQQYGGALVFNESFAEEGWTGGQSPASGPGKCIVNDAQEEPVIAAGKEGDLFVLDRTIAAPRVVEFGPGGSGCPPGSATVPSAKAGGVEVEPVPLGEKVTLSSKLTQANALSVEWEFGDGTKETVKTRQQQVTEVQHTFNKSGNLKVVEKIHTDNLATPLIEVTRQINIVGLPSVVTEGEPKVEGTAGTLKGAVNPNGQEVTKCEFEYGPTTAYGAGAKCATLPGSGESSKAVEAHIEGLTKHTTYHFRLVAGNKNGSVPGADVTFTSGPALIATSTAVSGTTQTTATLNATVNPGGAEVTNCHFEYGTSKASGASAPCASLPGSGESPVSVSAVVSGLAPGTIYHYRIVATTVFGATAQGNEVSFATTASEVSTTPGSGTPAGGGGTGTGTGTPTTGVLPSIENKPPVLPLVTLAGGSASVGKTGSFTLKVSCPAGESACAGTVTLRTLKAVIASVGHEAKRKAAILVLALGPFSLAGGQSKTITLHLTAKARALLARAHTLLSRATIAAHDPAGATHTTLATLTLRLAKHH